MKINEFIWKITNRFGEEYFVESYVSQLDINKYPEWIIIPHFINGEVSNTYVRRQDVFMISLGETTFKKVE